MTLDRIQACRNDGSGSPGMRSALDPRHGVGGVGDGRSRDDVPRRNADALDMGVMVDAEKVPDADAFLAALKAAFEDLAAAARCQA